MEQVAKLACDIKLEMVMTKALTGDGHIQDEFERKSKGDIVSNFTPSELVASSESLKEAYINYKLDSAA